MQNSDLWKWTGGGEGRPGIRRGGDLSICWYMYKLENRLWHEQEKKSEKRQYTIDQRQLCNNHLAYA